jgi:hypothetical protein
VFQLLDCSNCRRTFSIREQVSDSALLKCPNCGHQFRIGELLDALYEPWQIVEDPQAGHGLTVGDSGSTPTAEAGLPVNAPDTHSYNLAANLHDSLPESLHDNLSQPGADALGEDSVVGMNRASDDDELFEVPGELQPEIDGLVERADATVDGLELVEEAPPGNEESVPTAADKPKVDWSKFKSNTREATARARAPKRSPLASVIQVALGGLAAIPVTLLILWYGLGKDVADAGPTIARYVPWIVPKKFHPYPPLTARTRSETPVRGNSGFRRFDDVMPVAGATNGTATNGTATNGTESIGTGSEGQQPASYSAAQPATSNERETADANAVEPSSTSAIAEFATAVSPNLTPAPPATLNSAPTTAVTASDRPETVQAPDTNAELVSLIRQIDEASKIWPTLASDDRAVKQSVVVSLGDTLAEIGEHLADSSRDAPAAMTLQRELKSAVVRLSQQPALWEALQNLATAQARGRWELPQRGRMLFVELEEPRDAGDTVLARIRSSDPTADYRQWTVAIPARQAIHLTPSAKHLVLGAVRPGSVPVAPDPVTSDAGEPGAAADGEELENPPEAAPQGSRFEAGFIYPL